MGENVTERIVYYLKIDKAHKEQLGSIRHWDNLKLAVDKGFVWVKDFTEQQIHSTEIQQLPFKEIFFVSEQKLFPFGKRLPIGKAPSFLWTPIAKALKVELPLPNPNFFGLEEKVETRLIPNEEERKGIALLSSLKHLQSYTETAAAIRLKKLSWVLLDTDKVLILGTPLLPLPGTVFWMENKFLIPLGFHLELPILSQFINKKINPNSENWVLWSETGTYSLIPQDALQTLSLGSVRSSTQKL